MVDLFGVVLPGAIIVFLIWYGLRTTYREVPALEGTRWVAFIVLSYIAGHLVSAVGSRVLDRIYDYPYKLSGENGEYCRFRIRALELAKAALGGFHCKDDNILEWSTSFVRLGSAACSVEIDRLDADSKFFRSLTIVLILAWPIFVWSSCPWKYPAWLSLLTLGPIIFLHCYVNQKRHNETYKAFRKKEEDDLEIEKRNILQSARSKLQNLPSLKTGNTSGEANPVIRFFRCIVDPSLSPGSDRSNVMTAMTDETREIIGAMFAAQGEAEAAMNEKLAKPFRRAGFWTMVAWAVLMSGTAALSPVGNTWTACGYFCLKLLRILGGVLYAGLTVFAAMRYMELRLKRTTLTYRSVLAISTASHLFGPIASSGESKE